jgi:4-hydroxy 2-oxovalerate aldolase
MKIMDCTLRDGANVVGAGFSKELTTLIIDGLVKNHVDIIEMGHCTGLGTMKAGGKVSPVTDEEYLDVIQPFVTKAHIGMFQAAANADEELIALAKAKGLSFLRVGANAGDNEKAEKAVKMVRAAGLEAKYSMMKAYVLTADEAAEEAKKLEAYGVQALTIMDSAGYMFPEQAAEYTEKMKKAVTIPVGFHGHSNLGLAMANALAAEKAGADFIDCGLMGMARSAGNITTEGAIAIFQREGKAKEYDFYGLLNFIDEKLQPAMEKEGYHNPISPLDLVLGFSGCHSSFLPIFKEVAAAKNVDLYKLIINVSEQNQKNPSKDLMEQIAITLS